MKLPNYVLSAWLFLFITAFSFAQNKGTIKGSVSNGDGNQLGGILIILLQSDRTTISKTNLTENDSNFSFEQLPLSSYFTSISVNEFESFISNSILTTEQNPVVELSKIILKKTNPYN